MDIWVSIDFSSKGFDFRLEIWPELRLLETTVSGHFFGGGPRTKVTPNGVFYLG